MPFSRTFQAWKSQHSNSRTFQDFPGSVRTPMRLIYAITRVQERRRNPRIQLLLLLHPFNDALSGITQYQKGKTNLDLLDQETVNGSNISWAICISVPHGPCPRQITMPLPHNPAFYRPDALPATQPTATKHLRQSTYTIEQINVI